MHHRGTNQVYPTVVCSLYESLTLHRESVFLEWTDYCHIYRRQLGLRGLLVYSKARINLISVEYELQHRKLTSHDSRELNMARIH